jgi:hypothetical protein
MIISHSKRYRTFRVILFLSVVIAVSSLLINLSMLPAYANVNDTWEWKDSKRNLTVSFDASVTAEWKPWITEAIKNWNDANTGWTLTEASSGGDVTIKLGEWDSSEGSGNGPAKTTWNDKVKGITTGRTISFDKTPEVAKGGWSRTGNDAYDPAHVAKHELGHCLRLTHSSGSTDQMNVYPPGHHDTTVSAEDKQEAKDSVTAPLSGSDNSTYVPECRYVYYVSSGVGGVVIPVDKFGLLAPYIGLASTIIAATVATAVYIKRVKRRKEKQ